ncbi:MAG: hypothetical protein RIQ93_3141 [Verrucomicrobiota bacterium]|jgi:predicted dehydrogenase
MVGGAAALAGRTRMYGATAPKGSANGDIRIAVAGINGQGGGHVKTYYKMPGTKLVALCDVDSTLLAKRVDESEKAGSKVTAYRDFRKLLDDKTVDSIVMAPPNHWHSLMTIWALQAGKDVYVEKPLSHNVWEGRQAVAAAQKYNKNIVVAGTQNRSSLDIMAAIEYVHSGQIGKIQWVRGLCYKARESISKTSGPQPIPANIDYELWTGPADLTPPRRNSPARGPIHYDWHWFFNYGGGDMTNQGIHQMDIARWFLREKGLPKTVQSFGGRFGYIDDAETPNTLVSVFNYETAPLIFETRGLPMKTGMKAMDHYRGARVGVVVQCENGYVTVDETGTAMIYGNDKKVIKKLAEGGSSQHRVNFVKAMQSRKVVNGLIEECHYSSALCHLGNVSYLVGAEKSNIQLAEAIRSDANSKDSFARMLDHLKANDVDTTGTKTVLGPLLNIDGRNEKFVGGDKTILAAANKSTILKREGRGPFKIPVIQSGPVAVS